MKMSDIRPDLHDMIIDQTGLKPEHVLPESRLLEDLGMDGDDAVEFFAAFEDRYEDRYDVDLAELENRWSNYFHPEGLTVKAGLLVALGCAPGISIGIYFELGELISVALGLVGLFVLTMLYQRLKPENRSRGITIADLESAIETGRLNLPKNFS